MTHPNHPRYLFVCIFSLFEPRSLFQRHSIGSSFLFPPVLVKMYRIVVQLGLSEPIEQIADLYGKEHSRCPSFPKTTRITNTRRLLEGQQGNMAHGTHITVIHRSLKINTTQTLLPDSEEEL